MNDRENNNGGIVEMRNMPRWMRHTAVVVGYTFAYELLRYVSFSHWQLQVGLDLSFVLLLGRKYWPTILFAGVLAAVPYAGRCFWNIGAFSALLMLVPPAMFAMLPVWLLRRDFESLSGGRALFRPMEPGVMFRLLLCMGAACLLTALHNTELLALQILREPENYVPLYAPSLWIWRYLLGASIGALTVVPVVLAVAESAKQAHTCREIMQRAMRSRLLWEGTLLGVGGVVLLTILGRLLIDDSWRQVARLAMLAPVVWMAVRYGWQGAAVGGAAASVGVILEMPARYDPETLLVQTFMTGAIATLLLLGAVISRLNAQELRSSDDLRQALQSVRRELYQSELRMRGGIQEMRRIHDSLQDVSGQLLQQLQHLHPGDGQRHHRRQLLFLRNEMEWLENSIHPVQWQRRSLAAALWDGPIAQTLSELEIVYKASVPEAANALTPGAQMTLYRLACEAVAHLLKQSPAIRRLHLRLLVKRSAADDGLWTALVVDADGDGDDDGQEGLEKATGTNAKQSLGSLVLQEYRLSRLGAMGLGLAGMRDRASFYDGKVRESQRRNRISMSLRDIPEVA